MAEYLSLLHRGTFEGSPGAKAGIGPYQILTERV
jgi:hypothetical protein